MPLNILYTIHRLQPSPLLNLQRRILLSTVPPFVLFLLGAISAHFSEVHIDGQTSFFYNTAEQYGGETLKTYPIYSTTRSQSRRLLDTIVSQVSCWCTIIQNRLLGPQLLGCFLQI